MLASPILIGLAGEPLVNSGLTLLFSRVGAVGPIYRASRLQGKSKKASGHECRTGWLLLAKSLVNRTRTESMLN
jgi:hypothetical protein